MSRKVYFLKWAVFTLILIVCNSTFAGKIIYVDDDATGSNNGSNWQNAYKYLQDALKDANTATKPVEIRVAQGIYKPDRGAGITLGDRNATFQLINNVTLSGGYAGILASEPNERDIKKYETILSGDLADNDVDVNDFYELNEQTRIDNSFNVIISYGVDNSARIDSIIIERGHNEKTYLPGPSSNDSQGGINLISNYPISPGVGAGMYNINSSPAINKCTFRLNFAQSGSGMFNEHLRFTEHLSSPIITECKFIKNKGLGAICNFLVSNMNISQCRFEKNIGTAIFNSDYSEIIVNNCYFINNEGSIYGGAITNQYQSSVSLSNCDFIGNYSNLGGGAIKNWAIIIVDKCLFTQNYSRSDSGGAIYSWNGNINLKNCTFVQNSCDGINGAGAIYAGGSEFNNNNLINSILWNNNSNNGYQISCDSEFNLSIDYSCLKNGISSVYDPCSLVIWLSNNIDLDPLFADPNNGDYHLKSQAGRFDPNTQSWVQDAVTSPCIDAGDPNSPIGYEPFPNGGKINMGAYGGTSVASKSYFGKPVCETIVAGDINGDCKVDLADLEILMLHWLEWKCPTCDYNYILQNSSAEQQTSMPNPSAIYCYAMGYEYENRTSEGGGQYGVCIFPDGTECSGWDFYRGISGQQWSYCELCGYDQKDNGQYGWTRGALCVDRNTGHEIGTIVQLFIEPFWSGELFYPIGDLNRDWHVNMTDLFILVTHWLEEH